MSKIQQLTFVVIMFPCSYCDFQGSSKDGKLQHEEVVHEGAVTVCPICDAVLKYRSNLSKHIEAMHGTKTFPCVECDMVLRSKILLNRHKRDHHKEKMYQCETCDFKASTPSYLNRHKHYRAFYKFECDECDMKFKDTRKLKVHKTRAHLKRECTTCGFTTEKEITFDHHIITKHRAERFGKAVNEEVCLVCKIVPKTKAAWQKHRFMKHKEGDFIEKQKSKYSCSQCDYQAATKSGVKIHIQSKHEGIKYPCNHCDYQATERGNLQKHIQYKHEGIKYPCTQCDYQASTKGNLQTHIQRKHQVYWSQGFIPTVPHQSSQLFLPCFTK